MLHKHMRKTKWIEIGKLEKDSHRSNSKFRVLVSGGHSREKDRHSARAFKSKHVGVLKRLGKNYGRGEG